MKIIFRQSDGSLIIGDFVDGSPRGDLGKELWRGDGEPPQLLLDELSAQSPARNPDGLLSWLYSNDDYLALMESHGGKLANFERQISEDRYDLALLLWNRLPVSETLSTALFAADGPLVQFGYQDLIEFANK